MPIKKYFKGSGSEVMASMKKQYGEKKGKQVFYATANKQGMNPKGSMQTGGVAHESGSYNLHAGEKVLKPHTSVTIEPTRPEDFDIAPPQHGKIGAKPPVKNPYEPRMMKLHTGGVVPSDGTYELKAGEVVVPAPARSGFWKDENGEVSFRECD